jgi:hypothetical protein
MLRDVRHPKIKGDLVQKGGFWQGNAFGFEIASHIKNKPVCAFEQAGVVVQRTLWIAAICIQLEGFDPSGRLPFGGEKADLHASGGTTMHGVQNVCTQTHFEFSLNLSTESVYTFGF